MTMTVIQHSDALIYINGGSPQVIGRKVLKVSWTYSSTYTQTQLIGFTVVFFEGTDPQESTAYVATPLDVAADIRTVQVSIAPLANTDVKAAVRARYAGGYVSDWTVLPGTASVVAQVVDIFPGGPAGAWVIFDPGKPPATPHADSDEFNTPGTLDVAWTVVNGGPLTDDVATTVHQALYVECEASALSTQAISAGIKALPVGDWKIWMDVQMAPGAPPGSFAGLILTDTADGATGNQVVLSVAPGQAQAIAYTNWDTPAGEVSTPPVPNTPGRIFVEATSASGVITARISEDGALWAPIPFPVIGGFAPTHWGFAVQNPAPVPDPSVFAAFRFARITETLADTLGGLRTIQTS